MADLFENPMGLDGFEFVEFASPTPGILEPVFELMGFAAVAKHRSKDVTCTDRAISTSLSIMSHTVTPRISPKSTGLAHAEWHFVSKTRMSPITAH